MAIARPPFTAQRAGARNAASREPVTRRTRRPSSTRLASWGQEDRRAERGRPETEDRVEDQKEGALAERADGPLAIGTNRARMSEGRSVTLEPRLSQAKSSCWNQARRPGQYRARQSSEGTVQQAMLESASYNRYPALRWYHPPESRSWDNTFSSVPPLTTNPAGNALPAPPGRSFANWFALALCLAFFLQGLVLIPYLGVQNDEALLGWPSISRSRPSTAARILGHSVPDHDHELYRGAERRGSMPRCSGSGRPRRTPCAFRCCCFGTLTVWLFFCW